MDEWIDITYGDVLDNRAYRCALVEGIDTIDLAGKLPELFS